MEIPVAVSYDKLNAVPGIYTLTLVKAAAGDTPRLTLQPAPATYIDTVTSPEALTVQAVANGDILFRQ